MLFRYSGKLSLQALECCTGFCQGLLLLRSLRQLYLQAQEVSFHWIVAGQLAQATRDHELLAQLSGRSPDQVALLRYGPPASPALAAELSGRPIDPLALRAALLEVIGSSKKKAEVVLLMNGSKSQADLHKESGMDRGNVSRLVTALREKQLIKADDKHPELVIAIPSNFFENLEARR